MDKIRSERRDAWTKLSKKIVLKTRIVKIEGLGRHEEEPNGLQPKGMFFLLVTIVHNELHRDV